MSQQGFIPFKKDPTPLDGGLVYIRGNAVTSNVRHTGTTFPPGQDNQQKVTKKISKKPREERPQKFKFARFQRQMEKSGNLELFQHYMAMFMTEVYFTRKDGKIPSDSPYCEMDRIFNSDQFQAFKSFHERAQSFKEFDQHKQKEKEVLIIDE